MNNDEIKTLTNIICILPKVEIKDIYLEEDCFYIYQLVDGYKKLEKYFRNRDAINEILNKKIGNNKLIDLIRKSRNRYAHVDKHNEMDEFITMLTQLKGTDIDRLKTEIKKEIDEIYKRELNGDICRVLVNTKIIDMIFEVIKDKINKSVTNNEYEEHSKELLRPFVNNLKFDDLNQEKFDKTSEDIIKLYKSDNMKKSIEGLYGADIYNKILKMITDDSYTIDEMCILMAKIIKINNTLKNK